MKIIKSLVTNSDCYKTGAKIKVKGLMLHSVGCNQPSAQVFVNSWNKAGKTVCCHGLIDGNDGSVYQTLPWDHRAWHCGSSGNDTHISVEMCEPATIKYTGGSSWADLDPTATKATVMRTYKAAVELFAYLCDMYNLNPLGDGVIVSHAEGHKRGIASNHGDPEHIWKKYGLTMNDFRKDVKAAMSKTEKKEVAEKTETTEKAENSTIYRVQVGAYKSLDNGTKQLEKVKNEGFDAILVKVGDLYKVQCGAFGKKENATALKDKLEKAGFEAILTTKGGETVSVKKSLDVIAKEVIAGKWGNGAERRKKLEAAGYNYEAVQEWFNAYLG